MDTDAENPMVKKNSTSHFVLRKIIKIQNLPLARESAHADNFFVVISLSNPNP